MPIQLDKILADITEEKVLHPANTEPISRDDQDDAWIRVGKKNKLSAHEAKSIFKVLQKKFEQEKLKPLTTWKLYKQMQEVCEKEEELKPKLEPEDTTEAEEESFVEFLEVRDEDEDYDGDSDNQAKSMKSNSSTCSPEKDPIGGLDSKPEQKLLNSQMMVQQATTPVKPDYTSATQTQQQKQLNAAFTNALQRKGISMRKAGMPTVKTPHVPANQQVKVTPQTKQSQGDNPRSIILSETIKRKLQSVEKEAAPAKRSYTNSGSASSIKQPSTTTPPVPIPPVEIKQEVVEETVETPLTATASGEPINFITIPPNPTTVSADLANGITTIKTNGFNTRIEDLDFQKDIIFDTNPVASGKPQTTTGEIINIGNFENQLPPTFFKNLCNSQRHEALGLYVANVMNRVTGKSAAKLELNILKAIIEAQSDELARL